MTPLAHTPAGRPVELHIIGGADRIFALGLQIGPWTQRIDGTDTDDLRWLGRLKRDLAARLSDHTHTSREAA